jgi:type I restriction enzyme S subunit
MQKLFVDLLGPNWDRQRLNGDETKTLAALRDLLLPKLMSGEIRVREVVKLVAEVA